MRVGRPASFARRSERLVNDRPAVLAQQTRPSIIRRAPRRTAPRSAVRPGSRRRGHRRAMANRATAPSTPPNRTPVATRPSAVRSATPSPSPVRRAMVCPSGDARSTSSRLPSRCQRKFAVSASVPWRTDSRPAASNDGSAAANTTEDAGGVGVNPAHAAKPSAQPKPAARAAWPPSDRIGRLYGATERTGERFRAAMRYPAFA